MSFRYCSWRSKKVICLLKNKFASTSSLGQLWIIEVFMLWEFLLIFKFSIFFEILGLERFTYERSFFTNLPVTDCLNDSWDFEIFLDLILDFSEKILKSKKSSSSLSFFNSDISSQILGMDFDLTRLLENRFGAWHLALLYTFNSL